MRKEIIINTAQTQHFEFCKWALEKIGFSDIRLSWVKKCVTGRYIDGSKVELKCIAAKSLMGPGVRYYVISDSEKLVDALCTLFEGKSIYQDWTERENERKSNVKQEWHELFHSEPNEAESDKKDWVERINALNDIVQKIPSPTTSKYKKETLKTAKSQAKLQVDYYENLARCPKCGSTSLSGHKKGFGVGKALTGAALGSFILGPVGLLGVTAGNKGAKKLYVTCLNCGHKWKTKK